MYHVCLHLLSDDISILIGCRCTPLQGDWRPCMYSHRSVCLHLPSDDIHLYVLCTSKTGFGDCVFLLEGINLFKVSVFALTCTLR